MRYPKHVILISGIVIILVILLATQIEFRSFRNMTIDEMLETKFSTTDYLYAQDGPYYFVVLQADGDTPSTCHVIHQNKRGGYRVITTGPFALDIGYHSQGHTSSNGMTITAYKEKRSDVYVLFTCTKDLYTTNVIKDNLGEWPSLNSYDGTYFVRVLEGVEPSYQAVLEYEGDPIELIQGKTLLEKFQ